jgi:integrase/recombinase XerD
MGVGHVSWCRVRGPLAPWAAGYERWLAARGYARLSVRKRVCQLARLSSWLEREGLAVGELNEQRAESFLAARREAGFVTWVTSRCMELPLVYLREVGAAPPAAVVVSEGPWTGLLAGYRDNLSQAEFHGDSETRISVLGRGTPFHATTEEVSG